MEELQSHIWLTASSYMVKYLRISSYFRKPFLIYDFATAPFWISLHMRKILIFFFISVKTYRCLAACSLFFLSIATVNRLTCRWSSDYKVRVYKLFSIMTIAKCIMVTPIFISSYQLWQISYYKYKFENWAMNCLKRIFWWVIFWPDQKN